MSEKVTSAPETLVDALRSRSRLRWAHRMERRRPVALLWTDPDHQWRPLLPALRTAIPELYTLGEYDPANRTGPVIWLRCIVDRSLPDVSPRRRYVPILYLPDVARQVLRAAGDCPPICNRSSNSNTAALFGISPTDVIGRSSRF